MKKLRNYVKTTDLNLLIAFLRCRVTHPFQTPTMPERIKTVIESGN